MTWSPLGAYYFFPNDNDPDPVTQHARIVGTVYGYYLIVDGVVWVEIGEPRYLVDYRTYPGAVTDPLTGGLRFELAFEDCIEIDEDAFPDPRIRAAIHHVQGCAACGRWRSTEFAPLDDLRGSAAYRRRLTGSLFEKFAAEHLLPAAAPTGHLA